MVSLPAHKLARFVLLVDAALLIYALNSLMCLYVFVCVSLYLCCIEVCVCICRSVFAVAVQLKLLLHEGSEWFLSNLTAAAINLDAGPICIEKWQNSLPFMASTPLPLPPPLPPFSPDGPGGEA